MKMSRSNKNRKNPNKRMAASVHEGMASGVAKFRHSYSQSKRIIALVLALAMVLGLVYVDGKRKEARADEGNQTVTFTADLADQTSASIQDDTYFDGFINEWDLTDVTVHIPVNDIFFAVHRKVVIEENTKTYYYWKSEAVDSEDYSVDSDGNLTYMDNSYVLGDGFYWEHGTSSDIYLVKVVTVKNAESGDWSVSSDACGSKKITVYYDTDMNEAPTAVRNLAADGSSCTYAIGGEKTDSTSDCYYGKYIYKVYTPDSLPTGNFTQAADDMSDNASTAAAAIADGTQDGDYRLVRKIVTEGETPAFLCGWQGDFVRDDEIDMSSGVTTPDGTIDLNPAADVRIMFTPGQDVTYDVEEIVAEGGTALYPVAFNKLGETAEADTGVTIVLPKAEDASVKDRAGKSTKVRLTIKATGKKNTTQEFTITYDNGKPFISYDGTDTSVVLYNCGTHQASKDDNFDINIKAGTKIGTISSGGISCISEPEGLVITPQDFENETYVTGKLNLSAENDGVYKFTATIKNDYDIVSDPMIMTYAFDRTNPTISNVKVSQENILPEEDVTSLTGPSKKLLASKDVNLAFTLEDATTGIGGYTVSLDGEDISSLVTNESGTSNYTVTIPSSKLTKGATQVVKISAEDIVENPASKEIELTFYKEDISVYDVGFISNDTLRNIYTGINSTDELATYTGDSFAIRYSIKSDIPISSKDQAEITLGSDVITIDPDKAVFELKETTEISGVTYYLYDYIYTFAENETVSKQFDTISFKIRNDLGTWSSESVIKFLYVDLSKPELQMDMDSASVRDEINGDGRWYQTVIIKLSGGDGSEDYQSGLAELTITNVTPADATKANLVNGDDYLTYYLAGNTTLKVNDSTSSEGTAVSLTAKDNVGNTQNVLAKFYVDSEKPEATLSAKNLKDGSAIGSIIGQGAEPAVTYDIQDNLSTVKTQDTVYKYTFEIEKDGVSVYEETQDTENGLLSVTDKPLSEILADKYGDGEYVLKLYDIYDRAGNKAADVAPITFELDNTKPTIDKAVISQPETSFGADKTKETADSWGEGAEWLVDPKLSTVRNGGDANYTITAYISGLKETEFTSENVKIYDVSNNELAATVDAAAGTISFTDTPLETHKGSSKLFRIYVKDPAGNNMSKLIVVNFLWNELIINDPVIVEDNFIQMGEDNKASNNDDFSIQYSIIADAEVKEEGISFDVQYNGIDSTDKGTLGAPTLNEDGTYTYVYSFPVKFTESGTVKTTLSAQDINGVYAGPKTTDLLCIDLTKPEEGVYTDSAFSNLASQIKWYDDLRIYVKDVSEPGVFESGIKSIEITGDVEEVADNSAKVKQSYRHEDNGQYESRVEIKLKDNVGNENDNQHFVFHVDSTPPDIDETKLTVDGQTAAGLAGLVPAGYVDNENPNVTYYIGEDVKINTYKISITTPVATLPPISSTKNYGEALEETKTLKDLIGSDPAQGNYSIKLEADNLPENAAASKEINFTIDTAAPSVDLTLDQGGNIPLSEVVNAYTTTGDVRLTATKSFTINAAISDPGPNGSGIKTTTVTEKIGDGEAQDVSDELSAGALTIGADDKYRGKTVVYTFTAFDALGHKTEKTLTVVFSSEEITITSVRDKANETDVNPANGDKNVTNSDTINITYTIKSDVEILDPTVNDGVATLSVNGSAVTVKGNADAEWTVVKNDLYDYEYTLVYKIKLTDSAVLNNIKFNIKNTNGVSAKDDYIIDILRIDITKPEITSDITDQSIWYQHLDLVLTFEDGGNQYISGIKRVQISGVEEPLGGEYFIKEYDTYKTTVKENVTVLESETKAGTVVTIDVWDQLGTHGDQKVFNFKVDEHDPTTDLRVDDTDYSEVPPYLLTSTENPSVKYSAEDNIEIASYTFKIVLPDSSEITKSETDKNNISVSSTLVDLIGTTNCVTSPKTGNLVPKDGKYTISIEATDIAGRTAVSKPCTFEIDNTTPTNNLFINNSNPLYYDVYFDTYYGNEVGGVSYNYVYGTYYNEAVELNARIEDVNVKEITIKDNGNEVCPGATSGDNLFTVTDEGPHEITLQTEDSSGNKSDPVSLKFTIDKKAPVSTITVGGVDSATVNNKYIGHSETNKDPEIKFNVAEKYLQHEYQVDVTVPNGTKYEKVYFEQGTKDTYLTTGDFTKVEKLSELCSNTNVAFPLSDGLPQDGKYILSLKSNDAAGNAGNVAETTFYIDNTAPELNVGTINLTQTGNDGVIRRSTASDGAIVYQGVTAKAGSASGGKFTVTFDTKDPLVNETASGLAATGGVVVTETLEGANRNVAFTKTGDTVSFDVQADESYVGKVAEYTLKSTDAVGNTTIRVIRVSFAKDQISIKHRGFDNEATNSTNSKFTITYDITSDVPITPDENAANLDTANISLTMDTLDGTKDKNSAGVGVLKKHPTEYNADKFQYVYVYTYAINLTQSDKLKNIKVTVANNNGVVSEADLISLINIDLTDPAIAANNPNESMWFPSLQVTFSYNDGNREYMSGVKSIKITGVKQALDEYFQTEFDTGVKDDEGRVLKGSVTVDINESKDLKGTKVTTDIMDNLGRTMDTKTYTFHVDETNPVSALSVNGSSAADIDGTYIGTNTLNPTVAYSADDNIQIKNYALKITLPSGDTITAASGNNVKNVDQSTTLGDLIGKSNMNGSVPKDGTYTLTYEVYDMAGRVPEGGTITTTFTLDNTTPKNDLQITTGRPPKFDKFNSSYNNVYTGRSYSYGQYYNSSVSIDAIVVDNNVENITVTDNGSVIYSGTSLDTTHVISAEGSHTVAITTVDKAGLSAATESVTFTIDTTQPVLSTTLNNAAFPEGGATRYLNVNGDVGISYVETNKDTDDLIMTVTKNPPGGGSSVTSSKVNEGSQVFSDEADYTVKFAATDRAGNKSAERTVTFRVDRTKPELSFTGAADHGTSTKSVNMSYIVREAFYSDMNSCTLRIYKKVDGANEVLLKTVEIKPTSANYSMNELFEEDGEYRFEMSAEDKCGNPATASYTFILDGKAPIITLSGVKNYDKTSEDVTLTITVDETFFSSNKVVLKGTRIDIDGVKHDVKFSDFAANTGKISKFEQLFKEDGIYDITITSTDKAGNSSTQKIHFTKDTTDPEIKGIDDYDGTKINSFKWGTTAEEMVRDLTVCDIKVYMDGVEYDGLSDLADGSHVLRVIATDELGHTTDREVSFVLDTIAPNILIAGVEEGQYLKEATQITVSVQIDEDTLTRVTLDGKEIEIVNGVATFTVNQRGQYTIFVEAIDEAGNVATKQLNFNFGDRFPWWIFLVGAGGIFLMILLLLLARRRKDKKAA